MPGFSELGHRLYSWAAADADARGMAERRRALMSGLAGVVCEVGGGEGRMIPHLEESVTRYLLVEPGAAARAEAERAQAERGMRGSSVRVEVLEGVAEALPLPDRSVDAVVTSLVLCSVTDLERALSEFRRVLKPGGVLRFYEHIVSERPVVARLEALADPAWSRFAGGCRLTRDTPAEIERAGFVITSLERFSFRPLPVPPQVAHVMGEARVAGRGA